MINRDNWKGVKAYLRYRDEVDYLTPESIRLEESWLRLLLEWAQDTSFNDVPRLRPTFQAYLTKVHNDGQLSYEYVRKVISSARRFLEWLPRHRRGFRKLPPAWLDTLKPPRVVKRANTHNAVTLDEVRAIAVAPVRETWEKRIRAAAVFLFLSGMRVGAFATLPLEAVDLDEKTIHQWPSLGVRTKFDKQATTYLLDIPDLLEVIRKWDTDLRAVLPGHGYWFAPLSPETGTIDPDFSVVGVRRDQRVRKDLKRWMDGVGLPYHSPHKFRHGHAVYALKQCQDVAELKAVSQNLMHTNLSITDGVYGVLSAEDTKKRILGLGSSNGSDGLSNEELLAQVQAILAAAEGI